MLYVHWHTMAMVDHYGQHDCHMVGGVWFTCTIMVISCTVCTAEHHFKVFSKVCVCLYVFVCRYQGKGYQKPCWNSARFGRGRWRGRGRGRGLRMGRGRNWSHQLQPVDRTALLASEQFSAESSMEVEQNIESEDQATVKPAAITDVSLSSSQQVPVSEAGGDLSEKPNKMQTLLHEELTSEGEVSDDDDAERGPPCRDSSPGAVPEGKQLALKPPGMPSLSCSSQAAADASRENQAGIAIASSSRRETSRSQHRPIAKKHLTLLEKVCED